MAEYKKIEGKEKFDYSRMGKQTHKDFLKVKPKAKGGGCGAVGQSAVNDYLRWYTDPVNGFGGSGTIIYDFYSTLIANPPPGVSSTVFSEIAQYGNKIWVGAVDLTNTFQIVELDFDTSNPSAGATYNRVIDFNPLYPGEWMRHIYCSKNSTTVIGSRIISPPVPPTYNNDVEVFECDVSAGISATSGTPLFNIQALSGGHHAATTDLLYIPIHDTYVVAVSERLSPTASDNVTYIHYYSSSGTLLDSHYIGTYPQTFQVVYSLFCHNGKAYYLESVSNELHEILLLPLQMTVSLGVPGGYSGNFFSDAASSPECCGEAVIAGCMDPAALNYDPLATAGCNGVVGGNDTSCCEYPCHKLLI